MFLTEKVARWIAYLIMPHSMLFKLQYLETVRYNYSFQGSVTENLQFNSGFDSKLLICLFTVLNLFCFLNFPIKPCLFRELSSVLLKIIFITMETEATLPLLAWLPFFYFYRPYASICQIYVGAVIVKIKQANKMAGPVHSNCPLFR